jgi:hypothetical protein
MIDHHKTTQPDWPALLQQFNCELATLGKNERAWLVERLAAIETIQVALDDLFCKAGGGASCAGCDGACCDCGLHHFTLTNLLAYLLRGETPPAPDFSRPCPFLGERGCLLMVSRRPYNCITFFCDTLESQLEKVQRERLRELDRLLRNEYQSIERRYPAASLRGLWIAVDRMAGVSLLRQSEQEVVK